MKIGIIGAGLIGKKRALAATELGDRVTKIADIDFAKAKRLSNEFPNSTPTKYYKDILTDKSIDAVVVATTHNNLAKITYKALASGKHVLTEKPLGINVAEVARCVNTANKNKLVFKAGYNHRFHPAVSKAKVLFDKGKIGKIMYINAIYGHGGRPDYDKEWRMQKNISGGGELIDQGAHLIDLSLWFFGKIPRDKFGILTTSFWEVKVEDNAFIILKDGEFVANLHASWSEWKNRFLFEVYGQKGYIKINGLGGSYGPESLTFGLRIPGAAPKEKIWQFENKDISWHEEWQNFRLAISGKVKANGTGNDGLDVLKIAKFIYKTQK